MKTLVVTNDFPPRAGGIQTFVYELVRRLPPDEVVVYASQSPGWRAFDRGQPFAVVRAKTPMLLPTPRTRTAATQLLTRHGCTAVVFGAAAPLGLLARALRCAGAARLVALTHGHEAAWAALPGARTVLRRIGDDVDAVTYLGSYTRTRIAASLSPTATHRMAPLTPGVDADVFAPNPARRAQRRRALGVGERPVVLCVSRLMRRKGQDVLVEGWPHVLRSVPDAVLLVVGDGPERAALQRAVRSAEVDDSVRFTGSVPASDLPSYYAAADVFAMPARTRRGGLDVEGLGIVYLEASASGLPVVAGASGGAPDAVLPGQTGFVVDGRDVDAVAKCISDLLVDADVRRRLGAQGRRWVGEFWTWDRQVQRLRALLAG